MVIMSEMVKNKCMAQKLAVQKKDKVYISGIYIW